MKALDAQSQEKTISKRQVTMTDRSQTLPNPPANKGGGANDVDRLVDQTVGKLSETDVGKVSLIDGETAREIDCRRVADDEKATKTHGKDPLKTSVRRPNTFEPVITVRLHRFTIFFISLAHGGFLRS